LHEALVFEKEKNESLVEIYNSKDKKKKKWKNKWQYNKDLLSLLITLRTLCLL
jgi:hypothetical protein